MPRCPCQRHLRRTEPGAGGDADRGPGESRVGRGRGRPQRQRSPRGNVHRQPRPPERPPRAAVHPGPLPAAHAVPQRALRLPVLRPRDHVRGGSRVHSPLAVSPSLELLYNRQTAVGTAGGLRADDRQHPAGRELRSAVTGRQPELAARPLARLHRQLPGRPEHRRRLGLRDRRGLPSPGAHDLLQPDGLGGELHLRAHCPREPLQCPADGPEPPRGARQCLEAASGATDSRSGSPGA